MNQLFELVNWVYNYCTDFVINLTNILNLSYYEINFIRSLLSTLPWLLELVFYT